MFVEACFVLSQGPPLTHFSFAEAWHQMIMLDNSNLPLCNKSLELLNFNNIKGLITLITLVLIQARTIVIITATELK